MAPANGVLEGLAGVIVASEGTGAGFVTSGDLFGSEFSGSEGNGWKSEGNATEDREVKAVVIVASGSNAVRCVTKGDCGE